MCSCHFTTLHCDERLQNVGGLDEELKLKIKLEYNSFKEEI